jgi:hypothetical protein
MFELIPTAPTPLLMLPESAFVEVKLSTVPCPVETAVGLALNVAVGAGPPPLLLLLDPPQAVRTAIRPKSIADSGTLPRRLRTEFLILMTVPLPCLIMPQFIFAFMSRIALVRATAAAGLLWA